MTGGRRTPARDRSPGFKRQGPRSTGSSDRGRSSPGVEQH